MVLPKLARQLQHPGQRPAQAIQRRHLNAVARLEGSLQAIQPRPVPRGPLPTPSKTCSQSVTTRRWFSKLLASASLATDTRAYPWSSPIIFHWPQVLAWRRDSAAGRVLAMLENVSFRQGLPPFLRPPVVRFAAAIDTPVSCDVQTPSRLTSPSFPFTPSWVPLYAHPCSPVPL